MRLLGDTHVGAKAAPLDLRIWPLVPLAKYDVVPLAD
jgi:hypothetical protein